MVFFAGDFAFAGAALPLVLAGVGALGVAGLAFEALPLVFAGVAAFGVATFLAGAFPFFALAGVAGFTGEAGFLAAAADLPRVALAFLGDGEASAG